MSDWKPSQLMPENPMVNAVLNVAEGLHAVAAALSGIRGALQGTLQPSVAEAINRAGTNVAEGLRHANVVLRPAADDLGNPVPALKVKVSGDMNVSREQQATDERWRCRHDP